MALTSLLIFAASALGSYFFARSFVQRRLRFVDAMRSPFAPLIAGFAAFLIGILSAKSGVPFATFVAVAGMCTVLVGGLLRVYSE